MPSVGDIITGALQDITVVAAGEESAPEDLAVGLNRLNALLASWSLDGTNLYTKKRRTLQLQANKQDYEIGPNAADFNVPRPILWETAACILQGTQGFRSEVSILTSKQWAAIRDLAATQLAPDKVYLDTDFLIADGRSAVHVHPIPITAPLLEVFGWEVLAQFALVTDPFLFPAGYERAIRAALAIELLPSFPSGELDQNRAGALIAIAKDAKQLLQNANLQAIGALAASQTLNGPSQGVPMGGAQGAAAPGQ